MQQIFQPINAMENSMPQSLMNLFFVQGFESSLRFSVTNLPPFLNRQLYFLGHLTSILM